MQTFYRKDESELREFFTKAFIVNDVIQILQKECSTMLRRDVENCTNLFKEGQDTVHICFPIV